MTIEAAFRAAIEEEAADLVELAEGLRQQTGSQSFDRLIVEIGRVPARARSPREAEDALEAGALKLRRQWLDLADAETHRSYRSPPAEQTIQTPTRLFENFGYERELQPVALEERCGRFFGTPPASWRADHILFSSGQAAMAASLHLAERLIPATAARPLTVVHVGAYFETSMLLGMLPTRFVARAAGRMALSAPWGGADLILVEPVFHERRFTAVSPPEIAARLQDVNRPIVIFDDTLTGGVADAARELSELEKNDPRAVMRVASGLKLLQGGLELANVGIVSLYTRAHEAEASSMMRRLRALLGLGLRLSDVAGLEAPWFLDRDYTRRHAGAVFAHNAALARALAKSAGSIATVSHPSVDASGGVAPFCVLHLASPALDDYERLAERIRREAYRRDVLFERGGSFGFRGHRYDVVSPENAPPFLRVAMGRRRGWSLHGVISLLQDL